MSEDTLAIKTDDEIINEPTIFQGGVMTSEGLVCADGSVIPRVSKPEPRKGLTEEDEIIISKWVNDYHRDYPNVDVGLVNMFCSWAYRHPEACEEHVKEQKDKIMNMTSEQRIEMVKRNGFEELEKDYERMK
tara:strand:- start:66 stop:461 length:396 start_codon:yes stop_codon:yes gene_type:complete